MFKKNHVQIEAQHFRKIFLNFKQQLSISRNIRFQIHLKLAPKSGCRPLIMQNVHKFNEFLNIKTILCCHYCELLIYRAIKSGPSFISTCVFVENIVSFY